MSGKDTESLFPWHKLSKDTRYQVVALLRLIDIYNTRLAGLETRATKNPVLKEVMAQRIKRLEPLHRGMKTEEDLECTEEEERELMLHLPRPVEMTKISLIVVRTDDYGMLECTNEFVELEYLEIISSENCAPLAEVPTWLSKLESLHLLASMKAVSWGVRQQILDSTRLLRFWDDSENLVFSTLS